MIFATSRKRARNTPAEATISSRRISFSVRPGTMNAQSNIQSGVEFVFRTMRVLPIAVLVVQAALAGTVGGLVTDPQGRPVAGATVTTAEFATTAEFVTTTGPTGI